LKKTVSIGLIAGGGDLPFCFARAAQSKGLSLHVVAVRGSASKEIEKLSDSIQWVSLGQVGALISFLKKKGVQQAVMHGKVQHSELFKHFKLDFKALSLWLKLKDRSGEGLLMALSIELKKQGVILKDSRFLMDEVLTPKGFNVGKVDSYSKTTIAFGLKRARYLAGLGIGQTLVVKKNAVVAVEAMEGTDETIERAGVCAGSGNIIIKVSSPEQDWRFDVPTVGITTIQKLIQIKAKGIVLESGKSFLLEKDQLTRLAKKNNFFIKTLD
jgi:UDP-2,3-diacylglucosamine hydrolase